LFNSLNAVLGVIREDPRRAETALEELAELFRALMQDNRELAPLSDEIALARKYLEIEHLRLGERLRVKWEVSDCPPDVLAPPLLLQPLIENAVYHGIEPAPEPAEIVVKLSVQGERVRIEIDNPWLGEGNHRKGAGNHMALANLRERLMLFYDLEATLDSSVSDGRYRVRIDLPTRRKLHHE
jgi:two-component system sensor histidine kinase AlgZ